MNNTKFVHFNLLEDGGLYLHGKALRHPPATAIRWDDFINALVKFGLPSMRRPVRKNRPLVQPSIGELEEQYGGTVEFAIFKLYERRFVGTAGREIVGCVVKTEHSHGSSIVVMKETTAVFRRCHREFTSHVEYAFCGEANYNHVGMVLFNELNGAVKGLNLQDDEYRFLTRYYQNLLATI